MMSAAMVDEWARPQLRVAPLATAAGVPGERGAGPVGVCSDVRPTGTVRANPGRLRLTRRAIGLILGVFVLAMVASVVMIVTRFLAVSNDPIGVSW